MLSFIPFALVVFAAGAPAEPSEELEIRDEPLAVERAIARRWIAKADAAFEREQYVEAAEAYETAYATVQMPNLLYNIAQAHRLAGNCVLATSYYQRFLLAAPKDTPHAEAATRNLKRLESTCGKGEKAEARDVSALSPPVAGPVIAPVVPQPATDLATPSSTNAAPVEETITRETPLATATSTSGEKSAAVWPWIVGASGVVAAGVGVAFMIAAEPESTTVDGRRVEQNVRDTSIGAISAFAAGGAAIISAIIGLWLDGDEAPPPIVPVAPMSDTSMSVGVAGTF